MQNQIFYARPRAGTLQYDCFSLPKVESEHELRVEVELKRQYHELCTRLAEEKHTEDTFIVYNDVTYRFCASSLQAKKITGQIAKGVKRVLKVWQQNKEKSVS